MLNNKWFLFVALLFVLAGCNIDTTETIRLDRDGSGTYVVEGRVSKISLRLMDWILPKVLAGDEAEDFPAELEEDILWKRIEASKNELPDFFRENQCGMALLDSNVEDRGKIIHIQYSFHFNDINKLLSCLELNGSYLVQFFTFRIEAGDLSLEMKRVYPVDATEALVEALTNEETRAQAQKDIREQMMPQIPDEALMMEQMKAQGATEEQMAEAKEIYADFLDDLKQSKMEFYFDLPNEIKEVSGFFEKEDTHRARFSIPIGQLMFDDDALVQTIVTYQNSSKVICSADDIDFSLDYVPGNDF